MIGGARSAEAVKPFEWSEAELNISSDRTDRVSGLSYRLSSPAAMERSGIAVRVKRLVRILLSSYFDILGNKPLVPFSNGERDFIAFMKVCEVTIQE